MPGRVSSPYLVGRASELARLDELFAAADENAHPSVYVLAGEAGVGKSRLVGESTERVERRGGIALIGGCLELVDRALPYAPVVEALRQLVRRLPPNEVDTVIGGARRELAHLLPELDPDVAPAADDQHSQRRLFEHVLGVLERLGEMRTVVLVLEDLHWADRSTLDLFAFLARNLSDSRAMVIGTYRNDELHRRHPLRPVLTELDRGGRIERHELERFTRPELAELLAAIRGATPDDATIDEILTRSDGNAFFAEELLAAGAEGCALTPTLRDLLLARVDAVGDSARAALRIAAVIGNRVPHAFLDAVAVSIDGSLGHEALRECVEQQILLADDAGYRFRHALVQEAVYDDLLPGERAELHVQVAKVLSERPEVLDSRAADVDAELACHWYAAHDLPNALRAAVRAATSAQQMYAYPEALAHLERALELWDRVPDAATLAEASYVDIVRRTAVAADLSGRQDRALALAERALTVIDERADPMTGALVRERIARYMWSNGRPFDDIIVHNEAAVALVPADPPSHERALVEAAIGQQLMVHERNEEALVWCDAAIATARAVGDRVVEGHARNSRGSALAHTGKVDEGLAELYLALDIATENGAWTDVSRAYVNISGALEAANCFEEALTVAQTGLAAANAHGLGQCDSVFLRTHIAEALFELGRWPEAEDQLRALEHMDAIGIDAVHLDESWFQLMLHRGDVAGAETVFGRLMQYTQATGARDPKPYFEGALAIARGDLDRAGEILDKWLAQIDDATWRSQAEPCWFIVELLAATPDDAANRPDALARAEHFLTVLETSVAPPGPLDAARPHLPVLRAQARADLARVRGEHDPERWAEVAQMWERCNRVPHAAYARWREGEAALRVGLGPEAAAEPLRVAYRLADEMGATPIRRAVIDLATRGRVDLGVDVDDASGRAALASGLTAREIEVIDLVARGKTNRQIAEDLFISAKTASVHVSNIMTKLDAQNRGEAAARARELGLVV